MTMLLHPAACSQLFMLRQNLAEAFDRKDLAHIPALSAEIDRLQLACWKEEESVQNSVLAVNSL